MKDTQTIAKTVVEVLESCQEKDYDQVIANLINYLQQNNIEHWYEEIMLEIENLLASNTGKENMTVTTVDKLDKQALDLLNHMANDHNIAFVQSEGVIGGVVLEKDGLVADGTINGKLQKLKSALVN